MSIRDEGHPEDKGCKDALKALGREAGVDTMSCSECPFPFCVVLESRRLKNLARDIMIMAMHSMHASVGVIAARAEVSTNTVYKVIREKDEETSNCYWCKLDLKEGGVFCRPSYCTVAYDSSGIAVVLSSHRRATDYEASMIRTLVESLFQDAVIANVNDSKHDHWVVNRVDGNVASLVYSHMTQLSAYTAGLR